MEFDFVIPYFLVTPHDFSQVTYAGLATVESISVFHILKKAT